MTTLAAQVTSTGIVAPSYATILAGLVAQFQAIYGSDVYIAPDSQDGQFLAVIATAIHDCNQTAVDTYNSFSPTYAIGAGLSSRVKINGLQRLVPTYSTAVGLIGGTVGTVITGGVVQDANGNKWNVPTTTIPSAGQISVTVTAQQVGALVAPSGTINKIMTPQLGWQSFVSTADAVSGAPVESDAALRQRQAVSTSLPAQSPLGALLGAVLNVSGVTQAAIYENTGTTTDANGLPAKSIAVVVAGGTTTSIAAAIGQKKTPGAATVGTTSATYTDPVSGIPYTINYYALAQTNVSVTVNIKALTGYTSANVAAIQSAVSAYINAIAIGQPVQFSRLYAPAYQNGAAAGATYEVLSITLNGGTADVAIAFNAEANCPTANVTVNVS
jgi:uncharacterized phage protein gp47/JayE